MNSKNLQSVHNTMPLAGLTWQRDDLNPVLSPDPQFDYDCGRCMNPNIVRIDDQYRMYYAGKDANGVHRICMATSMVSAPTLFKRHGVVLDVGVPGAFDAAWCVLPTVLRIGNLWHLYYTGNDGSDRGLQSFWGIGLATSHDGLHFERYAEHPIIMGDQIKEFPRNQGIAGGSIVQIYQSDGSIIYRMYYTLSVGVPAPSVKVSQEKHCAVCHSKDGIHWGEHRLIMSPRSEMPHENIGVAVPVVWRDGNIYRMLYSAIGTRWRCYSIAEAASNDGYQWDRDQYGNNIVLPPGAAGSWEADMVEYPALVQESENLRLFYCGNNFGETGIGTAVAKVNYNL